ncbi:extracellular solute-binding protein [Hyphomicrobiaceae bacterium 22]|uniref:Extracellular solute-binding protein n=2 Tax=Prosthecodimorpha staleyi TaxID=2840188 RepID=A0A947D6Q6_9HYPH|nr:extracellular solute-binding protein [Prosthecodimorpha staleyi]
MSAPALHAEEPQWRHGLSLMGSVKYPADFKHFDYVNPKAPRGGVLRMGTDGTFDSFNAILPKGNVAAGIGLIYDSLMTSAYDEISTEYGQIAEAVKYPDDFAWVTFRLRPEARWHDGQPLTAEDVVWSFNKLKEFSPQQAFYYRHVVSAEASGPGEVTFRFDEKGNRELPQIVGQLSVMPKHWWEGVGPDGQKRDIGKTTLEPPLGGGAYKIKSFDPGKRVVYERVKDYWAQSLPVSIGQNNFDEIRYEYYRDDTVELEAFKGDQYDVRFENVAKNWATAYDFPAVRENRVILEKFQERGRGVGVGFVMNLRRAKFQDPRVRLALSYAFNYEEINRTVFFGQYERINSYFFGSDLAASGVPAGSELDILQEAKTKGPVPEEVFTKAFTNPVTNDPAQERNNLREAVRLLREAGYVTEGTRLVDGKTKEPLKIEFLINSPSSERFAVPYRQQLSKIGIDLAVRYIDSSQYINRLRSRDYDMIYTGWGQSLSPGNEQLEYFSSGAADREGSRNYAGIRNPAIDYVIQRVIYAKDRAELEAATRALDRLLVWNHYIVPGWTYRFSRMARWDRFSRPETLPYYAEPQFPTIWWWDAEKAAKTGGR